MGEVKLRRRLCRDRETGTEVFSLDRSPGVASGRQLSPCLEQMRLDFATRMSFGDAADSIAHWFPSARKMPLWVCTQESGDIVTASTELVMYRLESNPGMGIPVS